MIKKVVLYLLLFLLSLLIFLVCLLPASVLWEKGLAPQVNTRQLGLDVQKVVGTVWQGQALLRYKGLSGVAQWDVELQKLMGLSLPIKLSVNSEVGDIKAMVNVSASSIKAEINHAQIELALLSPLFKSQRLSLDGELFVKNLTATVENKKIIDASGVASWSGGDIAYPAGRVVHERTLPMFKAVLKTAESGEIYLGVRDAQASFDVINADLKRDGTAMLRITRRLLDLSREPWSQNSTEQDVVFKVKKVLY